MTDDMTKQPYIKTDEFINNMDNIKYMEKLDYTLYENSDGPSSVPLYIANNTLNLSGSGEPLKKYMTENTQSVINLDSCKQTKGLEDISNCGLIHNASGILRDINRVNNYDCVFDDSCGSPYEVVVSNYKNRDSPITVSLKEYETSQSTAYVDNCKKYNGMIHCDACDLKRTALCDVLEKSMSDSNTNVQMTNSDGTQESVSLLQWLDKPASDFENGCKKYDGMEHCSKCFNTGGVTDICPNLNGGVTGEYQAELNALQAEKAEAEKALSDQMAEFDSLAENFQCFYNRYKQPLNNYVQETIIPQTNVIVEKVVTTFHTEDDVLTTVYLGGISIMGLYILYRLMEK